MKDPKAPTRLIFSLLLGTILSSCSFHLGTTGAGSAAVTNKDFALVDFAYGTARTVNVFGIGANSKDALVLEAKRNLYLNYELAPGQALGNITVDFKRTLFFPVLVTKVTLSAEVVDFSGNVAGKEALKETMKKFTNETGNSKFDFGQYVNYTDVDVSYRARILGSKGKKVIIQYFDTKNNFRTKRVWPSELQFIRQDESPIDSSVPDKLFTPQNPKNKLVKFRYKGEVYTGELMESNDDNYLIRMETGEGKLIGLYIDKKDLQE